MTRIPPRDGESSTSTSTAPSIKDGIELESMSDEEKAVYDTEHRRKVHAEDASETENASDEPGVHYHDDKPVTFWTRFDRFNQELERKIGIESRGIERVPDSAKTDKRLYGNTYIWLAANCVLPTLGLGVLGPAVFGLGLGDSLLTIFFINLFGALLPACIAVFGVKLGLRQMTSARFSWGWHGAKVVAFLNCIACVGWSIVNTIAGTQALVSLSEYKISDAVGVVIIALATLVVGMFGYRVVHTYEKYSWIPTAIAFLILLGVAAKHLVNTPMGTGQAEAASVLSFACTLIGFVLGWTSLASDFNVYMPSESPSLKVAAWTYLGLIFPLVLVQWLGAAIAAAAQSGDLPTWGAAYEAHELGGLLGQILIPSLGNFGKFVMMLLVLSVIANNIVNVYSMGFSVSVIHHWLAAVPRLLWPVFITAIYIPVSIVLSNSFGSSLTNFLDILGYWLCCFNAVVWEEHFIFRKGDWNNYQVSTAWNDKRQLSIGYAAVAAGCFGVMGAVLGMAQVWFIGPIGKLVGGSANPYGGDIAWILAPVFTGITYPPFRLIEKRFIGR